MYIMGRSDLYKRRNKISKRRNRMSKRRNKISKRRNRKSKRKLGGVMRGPATHSTSRRVSTQGIDEKTPRVVHMLGDPRVNTQQYSEADMQDTTKVPQAAWKLGQCEDTFLGNKCKCIFNNFNGCTNYYWTGRISSDGWYNKDDNQMPVPYGYFKSDGYEDSTNKIYICPEHIDKLMKETVGVDSMALLGWQPDESEEWNYIFDNYINEYEKELIRIGKGYSIKFLPEDYKKDMSIILTAISLGMRNADLVDASLKKDPVFIHNAIKLWPSFFKEIAAEFKRDQDFAVAVISLSPYLFDYVDESLKKDPVFIARCMNESEEFKDESRYADWFIDYRHILGLPEGWQYIEIDEFYGLDGRKYDFMYINESENKKQVEYPNGTPIGWSHIQTGWAYYYINDELKLKLLDKENRMFGKHYTPQSLRGI